MVYMKLHKNMTNLEIAELLRSVAASYEHKNADKNKFRIIAYNRAADAVEHLSSEAKDLWDEGKLDDVAGIGESINKHLSEIFKTGKSKHFKKVMAGLPPAMFELMKVPGIGAKTAFKLSKKLGIKKGKGAIKRLEKAVKKGKISGIEGFGEQSQEDIAKSIKEVKGRKDRMLLPYATKIAGEVISWLKKDKIIIKADPLGSLRRKASTIGDIDISIASNSAQDALQRFTDYPKKKRVLEKGDRTASIILPGDVQVDVMVQEPESYGSLLQHFTGSKHHSIALREYSQKKGLSLSEYGIKKLKSKGTKLKKFSSEENFYKYLGMDWIPPELREDTGEIDAAINNKLPKLVNLKDIKGDLQIHSDFDIETSHDVGEDSMQNLVKKASELNYKYIAFTEHNPSQRGHKEKDIYKLLKAKKEKIEHLNETIVKRMKNGVRKVFNSLEIDILPDGNLPVSEKSLELLDFALVSIHSSFRQSRKTATKRVVFALEYPKVKIFAHPTGRKLGKREGVELEWPKIFEVCKKKDIWLEINADPMRLDLPDFLVKEAIKEGVKITLGTDAHSVGGMDNMRFGVSVARRGWATKKDIVNTRSLVEFERMIK
jgi:DNA polymerase (family 10)